MSKLLDLKEEEMTNICNCNGFCHINHAIRNWKKPQSKEILMNLRKIEKNEVQVDTWDSEYFECQSCDARFRSLDDLKDQSKTIHEMSILKICTSNQRG